MILIIFWKILSALFPFTSKLKSNCLHLPWHEIDKTLAIFVSHQSNCAKYWYSQDYCLKLWLSKPCNIQFFLHNCNMQYQSTLVLRCNFVKYKFQNNYFTWQPNAIELQENYGGVLKNNMPSCCSSWAKIKEIKGCCGPVHGWIGSV